jgi:hypothetical protein
VVVAGIDVAENRGGRTALMKKPKGVDPTQAREKVEAGTATLVCAYEEEEKCSKVLLDGSITMKQLKATLAKRQKDEELVFYCA